MNLHPSWVFTFTMERSIVAILILVIGCNPIFGSVLLKHLPKAGGSYLVELGSQLLGPEFQVCHEFDRLGDCIHGISDPFVIGLIREPCSMYLSLWSYGSEGHGMFASHWKKQYAHLSKKNDGSDASRFEQWIKKISPEHPGAYSLRFFHNYLSGFDPQEHAQFRLLQESRIRRDQKTITSIERSLRSFTTTQSTVDCWVDTAFLVDDFYRCLQMYKIRSNSTKIDPTVFESYARDAVYRSNASNHSKCSDYYSKESMDHVMNIDHDIYRVFGFIPCGSWSRSDCTESDYESKMNPCL